MPDAPDHLSHAELHLAEARKWIDWTENGTLFDPVRDHTGLALAHVALELARRWPAPPAIPAAASVTDPPRDMDKETA